ncbi:cupin domain-containing protein [Candidatus Berkelbacteria bacterium]|nr:cupin domain-containing protein [Candidatus Berkelbacteria bacterium]
MSGVHAAFDRLEINGARCSVLVPERAGTEPWREVGKGLTMLTLWKTPAGAKMVLYSIAEDAPHDVFRPHRHPGGELCWVIKGAYQDEGGTRYEAGSEVWYDPGSQHAPRPTGQLTVLKVFWPAPVQILETQPLS